MKLAALIKPALCGLFLAGCSAWQPAEQRAFAFAATCHAVDLMQTDWALENGFKEANPILGENPSDNELMAFKAAALGVTWWVAENAAPEDRWKAVLLATVPCVAAVAHNYSEGARP